MCVVVAYQISAALACKLQTVNVYGLLSEEIPDCRRNFEIRECAALTDQQLGILE